MSSNRKIVIINEGYYHIFNRGVDKRKIFLDFYDYRRALKTLTYYKSANISLRLSHFLNLSDKRQSLLLNKKNNQLIEIIAYCLMPNHFHLLLKQIQNDGVSTFISNFSNSYTKYFNTKTKRTGHLLQGRFKAVPVESDMQLAHLSRYIHLNPVASSLVTSSKLKNYQWSSYQEYLSREVRGITNPDIVTDLFKSSVQYENFVLDQANYLKSLREMENLDFP